MADGTELQLLEILMWFSWMWTLKWTTWLDPWIQNQLITGSLCLLEVFQNLYWHHAWPPANPSQAAYATLWLTDTQWASVKQPWSAAPWASTPVQQPDTTEHSCPNTKFFRALKETQSQPGGTATLPSGGSFHLVEQDLNESSGTGYFLFLIWILTLSPKCLQWTIIEGVANLLVLRAHAIPTGEITVSVF